MTFRLPPPDQQRQSLLALMQDAGLAAHATKLESLFAPGIAFRTHAIADSPLGASRMGGPADLPEGLAWPEADGEPLTAILQLDFSDVASLDPLGRLPPDGWLHVFADTYWDHPTVLYTPAGSSLKRGSGPTLPNMAALSFQPTWQPAPPSSVFVGLDAPANRPGSAARMNSAVALPEAANRAYGDKVWLGWEKIIAPNPGVGESGCHQLLGHTHMEDFREANEEVLLCIDSDAIVQHQYGDGQRAKLLIDRDALARRDFSAVRVGS